MSTPPPTETFIGPESLQQQIRFMLEIDKLKQVLRQSLLLESGRRENSAEHSWHIATFAMVLAEHANAPVDLLRVIKMLLLHDIVEIDAGDTYAYDSQGREDQHERELAAARRIFGLLPQTQRTDYLDLWLEFEARQTPEARFANAVDRIMPLFHNFYSQGESWQRHGVTREQVIRRVGIIDDGSHALWSVAEDLIDRAVALGYLAP